MTEQKSSETSHVQNDQSSDDKPRSDDVWAEATDQVRPPSGDAESSADSGASAGADHEQGDPMRKILADVAAGRISPEEAATMIDALRAEEATKSERVQASEAGPATDQERDEERVPVSAATTRLQVRAVGRRVRIVGEPFVSTVAVDGPHVVRQEGDTLVVTSEGEFGASIDGFTLMRSRSLRDVQERVFDFGRELSVRVNPDLMVEVEVTAGSVNAERLPKLEQVRVTAGSARVRDAEGPLDLLVQAGSAQVEGKITKGRSRLRAESGSLQLRLLPGSSVRIRPDVQLGRVQWDPPGRDREEHVVGLGDATLDLEVVMGTATVKEAP
ncbi:MAG TPA: hypothetical protein VIL34_16120 [Actinopolymorphaceae bacterium]|jgi:hypothetical protein